MTKAPPEWSLHKVGSFDSGMLFDGPGEVVKIGQDGAVVFDAKAFKEMAMAVSYGNAANGIAAAQKLGVPNQVLKELQEAGFELLLKPPELQFRHGTHVACIMQFTMADVMGLKNGTITPKRRTLMRAQLIDRAEYCVKKLPGEGQKSIMALLPADLVKAAAEEEAKKVTEGSALATGPVMPMAAGKAAVKVLTGETELMLKPLWATCDPKQLSPTYEVKLRDATKMYEPVTATTQGKRYFVVGGNDKLRVAAHWKPPTLSIRIESKQWPMEAKAAEQAGFTYVPGKSYASLHFEITEEVVARKALGAVLLGLGIPLTTPLPDLAVIRGLT